MVEVTGGHVDWKLIRDVLGMYAHVFVELFARSEDSHGQQSTLCLCINGWRCWDRPEGQNRGRLIEKVPDNDDGQTHVYSKQRNICT